MSFPHEVDNKILDDLSKFDEQFAPTTTRSANLEALTDGSYAFDVAGAELTQTSNSKETLLRLTLKVVSGPSEKDLTVEHTYFFRSQENANRCGGDMKALGFPAEKWVGCFSTELGKAVPKLPGVRFRATKKTNTRDGKTYHNLNIDGRIAGGNPPPPGSPSAAPPPPSRNPPAANSSDDIPF